MKKIFEPIFICTTWLFSLTAFQTLGDTVDGLTQVRSCSLQHNVMQAKAPARLPYSLTCNGAPPTQRTHGETWREIAMSTHLLLLLLADKCPSHRGGQNAHPLNSWVSGVGTQANIWLAQGPQERCCGRSNRGE